MSAAVAFAPAPTPIPAFFFAPAFAGFSSVARAPPSPPPSPPSSSPPPSASASASRSFSAFFARRILFPASPFPPPPTPRASSASSSSRASSGLARSLLLRLRRARARAASRARLLRRAPPPPPRRAPRRRAGGVHRTAARRGAEPPPRRRTGCGARRGGMRRIRTRLFRDVVRFRERRDDERPVLARARGSRAATAARARAARALRGSFLGRVEDRAAAERRTARRCSLHRRPSAAIRAEGRPSSVSSASSSGSASSSPPRAFSSAERYPSGGGCTSSCSSSSCSSAAFVNANPSSSSSSASLPSRRSPSSGSSHSSPESNKTPASSAYVARARARAGGWRPEAREEVGAFARVRVAFPGTFPGTPTSPRTRASRRAPGATSGADPRATPRAAIPSWNPNRYCNVRALRGFVAVLGGAIRQARVARRFATPRRRRSGFVLVPSVRRDPNPEATPRLDVRRGSSAAAGQAASRPPAPRPGARPLRVALEPHRRGEGARAWSARAAALVSWILRRHVGARRRRFLPSRLVRASANGADAERALGGCVAAPRGWARRSGLRARPSRAARLPPKKPFNALACFFLSASFFSTAAARRLPFLLLQRALVRGAGDREVSTPPPRRARQPRRRHPAAVIFQNRVGRRGGAGAAATSAICARTKAFVTNAFVASGSELSAPPASSPRAFVAKLPC